MYFSVNWQTICFLWHLNPICCYHHVTSSINMNKPVPEVAMQAQAQTLPPICFTDELVCFLSYHFFFHILIFPYIWYQLLINIGFIIPKSFLPYPFVTHLFTSLQFQIWPSDCYWIVKHSPLDCGDFWWYHCLLFWDFPSQLPQCFCHYLLLFSLAHLTVA